MHLAVSVTEHKTHPVLQSWMTGKGICVKLWLGFSKEEWLQEPQTGSKWYFNKYQ